MNAQEAVWQCETCGTIYAEYVNGCPHCWDAGLRSKVVCRREADSLASPTAEKGK